MDYEEYRTSLIQGYYDHQLETLMSEFDPRRKTVILLPGGMGSQLERTEHAYPASPNVINDVVWLDAGIIFPKYDALKLEIDGTGKDEGEHVIAAHGPVRFFWENPYTDLRDRARVKGWNYGVFGYDWRRPLKESSEYFKRWILDFQQRVRNDFGAQYDPIPNLTIVCHSMGGLVATTALSDAAFSGLGFSAIMTIATPFYGTSTQQERYFMGIPSLNAIYGAKVVVRIVGSLPGPYTLMFPPKAVYDANHAAIGLSRYPVFDATDNGKVCDPYDVAMLQRWPTTVRNNWQAVQAARNEMIGIAAPINANIAPKFFNVRSRLDNATAVELIWNDIDGDTIDPEVGPSPLAGLAGPGDGTVPGWSAFHAHCTNRLDLLQAKDHGNLLRHEEVLTLIEKVVATGKLPSAKLHGKATVKRVAKAAAKGPKTASPQEVNRVLGKWAAQSRAKQAAPPPAELFEKSIQSAFLGDLIGGTKPRLVGTSPLAADQTPALAGKRTVKRQPTKATKRKPTKRKATKRKATKR